MARSIGFDPFKPNNPDAPYFQIKIMDTIYDISHNFIENLTIKLTQEDIGSASFSIVNYSDRNLENRLMDLFIAYGATQAETSGPPISIRFGWSLAEKSKWRYGYILDFTPEYMAGGFFRFTVDVQLLPWNSVTDQIQSFTAVSASDAVRQIAEANNWVIVDMDEAERFPGGPQVFRLTNISPVEYINKKILPLAYTADKHEPYRFFVEDNADEAADVYFISVNKPVGIIKNYNFYINMGNYGSVLSWAPSYKGKQMAGFMQSAYMDIGTNEIYSYGNKKGAGRLAIYGAASPDIMGPLLTNKWYHENIGQFNANLTIVGDPTLRPWQFINVCPMLDSGEPHLPTMGTYRIQQITHTLGADFRTDLELIKMTNQSGNMTLPLEEAIFYKGKQ